MQLDDVVHLDPAAARGEPAPSKAAQWACHCRAKLRTLMHVLPLVPISSALARAGLRARMLSIILLSVLPLFTLLASAGLFDRHEQLAFNTSRVGLLAKAAAARASASISAAAELSRVLRSIGAFDNGQTQCAGTLQRLDTSGTVGITGVTLFDGNGDVRCTSKPIGSDANVRDRSWFKDALAADQGHFVVSRMLSSRVFGTGIIEVASPLRTNGHLAGVIAVALDMTWFTELANKLSAEEGGCVLIIDRRDGTVLGTSGQSQTITGRRFPNHKLTAMAMSSSAAWAGILPDYDGNSQIFGLAAVQGPAGDYATIAIGLPERAIRAAANVRLATELAAAAAATLAVGWLFWRLANGVLLRPLQHLTERVRSVHLGDLSKRAHSSANISREMRLLFESFNEMAATLKARGDALAASRAELAASEEHHRILSESATDMITRFDANLVRLYVSPACRDVLGYEPSELVGVQPQGIVHPDDVAMVNATLNSALLTGHGEARAVYRAFRKDGREIWVETSGKRLPGGAGAVVVTRDVSERKRFEASLELANRQLDQLARLDALTGLYNRRAFDEQLAQQLRPSTTEGVGFALVLFDVDWFKVYNDTYGHQAGDECLKMVAATAQLVLRNKADFAARYGGEEFALILPGASEAGASLVAERIVTTMAQTRLPHQSSPLGHVTVSLGVAVFDPPGLQFGADELLARADAALYRAKSAGRNRFCLASDA